MSIQDLGSIGSLIGGLATLIAAFIAWNQLSNLNKSLNDSNLMTIFEIEFELNRRKEKLAEVRTETAKIFLKTGESSLTEEEEAIIDLLESHRKEANENYLNIFDRLCYFILHEKLQEEDFRLEYRDMLFNTIDNDQEDLFGTSTKFRNMIKLYSQWKEK